MNKQLYVSDMDEDAIYLSDSQDVEYIRLLYDGYRFDSFFVTCKDGEYTTIYGMHGIVPFLCNPVFKVL